jgi:hypothetical protein
MALQQIQAMAKQWASGTPTPPSANTNPAPMPEKK